MTTRAVIYCVLIGGLAMYGCGDDEGEDGGVPSNDIRAIDSTGSARSTAKDIVEVVQQVRGRLSNGSYSNQSFSGGGGTAKVTGAVSYQSGISCGSSCVRSESNTSITVVFNNYSANTASNTTTKINGTVTYTDTTYSRQSGLSYTSGGSVAVGNTNNIAYEYIGTDAVGTFGTRDTISYLRSSGASVSSQHGTLTTAGGNSFTF